MLESSFRMPALARRAALALIVAAASFLIAPAAIAASPAEAFVDANVSRGLAILNNKSLNADQRKAQFQTFILGLTDMHRIANFTLGVYRRSASQARPGRLRRRVPELRHRGVPSYFTKYSGQTLRVTGSQDKSPGDTIVTTQMIDPADQSGQQPLEVDFRVLTDNGRFVVIDFSVAGIWLAIEERDQFSSFLGQNGGSIPTLISHLHDLAKSYH